MIDTKLVQVLRVFSKKELKQLQTFIHSPLFNSNKKQYALNCELFDYIIQFAPKFEHKKMSKEIAFQYLFPKKKQYRDQDMRYLLSNLLKLVEQYIVWQQINQDEWQEKMLLLDFYEKKRLLKHFEGVKRILENYKKNDKKMPFKDVEYYYNAFLLERKSSLVLNIRQKGQQNSGFQKRVHSLDQYYLLQQLYYYCEIISRAKVLGDQQYQAPLIEELLSFLPKSKYINNVSIALYYQATLMLKNIENIGNYRTLKELLHNHHALLEPMKMRNLYAYARNFCVWQPKERRAEFMKELLSLYDMQLSQGLLYENGYLIPPLFKNIVTTGLKIGDLVWTEHFIENNIEKVEPKYQQEVSDYNYAHLHFHQKKYVETIDLLIEKVENEKVKVRKFEDIFYQVSARRLLIKAYYELDEFKIEDAFNNLEVFLSMNKVTIAATTLERNRNFIKLCKRMYKLSPYAKGRQEKLSKIGADIDNTPQIADRKWIEQKYKALL